VVTTTSYHYDGAGNTTAVMTGSVTTKRYEYDLRGRLRGVSTDGDSTMEATYAHASSGSRVGVTEAGVGGVGGETTPMYLVDEQNLTGYAQVLEEHTDWTLERSFVIGADVIGQPPHNPCL
jgi:YD repeat-containing protein